jgi:hypothetical protein
MMCKSIGGVLRNRIKNLRGGDAAKAWGAQLVCRKLEGKTVGLGGLV